MHLAPCVWPRGHNDKPSDTTRPCRANSPTSEGKLQGKPSAVRTAVVGTFGAPRECRGQKALWERLAPQIPAGVSQGRWGACSKQRDSMCKEGVVHPRTEQAAGLQHTSQGGVFARLTHAVSLQGHFPRPLTEEHGHPMARPYNSQNTFPCALSWLLLNLPDLRTSSVGLPRGAVRNAASQTSAQTYSIRICIASRSWVTHTHMRVQRHCFPKESKKQVLLHPFMVRK